MSTNDDTTNNDAQQPAGNAATPDQGGAGTNTSTGEQQAPAGAQDGGKPVGGSGPASWSHDELVAEVTKLRNEAAERRVNANQANQQLQEFKDALGAALGFKQDEQLTPEQLQQKLTEADQQLNSASSRAQNLERENAVLRYAAQLGADGDRLLDSRSFLDKLSAVDPSKPEAVKAAITDALKANPTFAITVVPGSSGGTQHQGGDNTTKPKTLAEAARARLGF